MFCTKCGYNAGTAKFCPKCGNPLNPQPVQETPVQNEPVVQTVQSEPVVQQQFGTQPQSGAVPPVNADYQDIRKYLLCSHSLRRKRRNGQLLLL